MVFFRYDDVPGVIGRVGTLFGQQASTSRTWPSRGAQGREGADGALARHDAAARARRGGSRRGLRRCTDHRPRLTIAAAAGSSRQFILMVLVLAAGWLPPGLARCGGVGFLPVPRRSLLGALLVVWSWRTLDRAATPYPAAPRGRAADRDRAVRVRAPSALQRRPALLPRLRACDEPGRAPPLAALKVLVVEEGGARRRSSSRSATRSTRVPRARARSSRRLGPSQLPRIEVRSDGYAFVRARAAGPSPSSAWPPSSGRREPRRGSRSSQPGRRPPGRRRGRRLRARPDRQVARLRSATARPSSRSCRATGAPTRQDRPRRRARRRLESRGRRGGGGDRASRPAPSPVSAPDVDRVLIEQTLLDPRRRLGRRRLRDPHMAGIPASLVRLARAQPWTPSRTHYHSA